MRKLHGVHRPSRSNGGWGTTEQLHSDKPQGTKFRAHSGPVLNIVFSTKPRSHQASGPLALPCTDEFTVSGTMASGELGELIMKFISGQKRKKKKKYEWWSRGSEEHLPLSKCHRTLKPMLQKAIFPPEAFLHWYTDKTDGCCPVGKDATGQRDRQGGVPLAMHGDNSKHSVKLQSKITCQIFT